MAIITISRQLGSMGAEIAKRLSEHLKCRYLDRQSLEAAFGEYGVSRESVERFDEKKPGFWDLFKNDKARYLHFLKGAIYQFAQQGNCIIMGRGGQVILEDLPGVLHVKFIAPMKHRIDRIKKRFDCDAVHAEKIIQHSDEERAGFYKFFFGVNWENPDQYNMVINTATLSADSAVDLIRCTINTPEFKKNQDFTAQKLADLSLEHKVKTSIVYDEQVFVQFLEIVSENGIVTLRGIVESNDDLARCEKIAAMVDGVKEVKNNVYFSPITSAYGIHY